MQANYASNLICLPRITIQSEYETLQSYCFLSKYTNFFLRIFNLNVGSFIYHDTYRSRREAEWQRAQEGFVCYCELLHSERRVLRRHRYAGTLTAEAT